MSHIVHNGIKIVFPTAKRPNFYAYVGNKTIERGSLAGVKAELRKANPVKPFSALAITVWGRNLLELKIVRSTRFQGQLRFVAEGGSMHTKVYPADRRTRSALKKIVRANRSYERQSDILRGKRDREVKAIEAPLTPFNASDYSVASASSALKK